MLPNYSVSCHETVSGEGSMHGEGWNNYYFETAEELRVFLMNRVKNLFDEKDGHPIVDAEGKPTGQYITTDGFTNIKEVKHWAPIEYPDELPF